MLFMFSKSEAIATPRVPQLDTATPAGTRRVRLHSMNLGDSSGVVHREKEVSTRTKPWCFLSEKRQRKKVGY